jgi:iron complex outermembrane receptor protein
MTAYAGFAQNSRTPTASEIECSNPLEPCLLPSSLASDPPQLRQVVAQTFELGARGHTRAAQLGGTLSWNADLFRTNVHDDIYGIATSVSRGYFQNIGATRRSGVEAALRWVSRRWSAHLDYSHVDATFAARLLLPSPANPHRDGSGDIRVRPGDRLPGIPEDRLKLGADYQPGTFSVGADIEIVSSAYFAGDESNQNPPLPGYAVLNLFGTYTLTPRLRLSVTIGNLFNGRYATYGTYGDPTGVGAPGVPASSATNGPAVDNRFESPAAPFSLYGGVRLTL